MKKLLSFLFLILGISVVNAKSVTIDGICYTLHGKGKNGTVSIKVENKNQLPNNLVIPSGVVIEDREYPVTKVEGKGFEKCNNIVSIVLPNTVTHIGKLAFLDCTSLQTAVLPDYAKVDKFTGDYGYNAGGIFKGCTSLQDVRGTNVPYPQYIVYEAIYECQEVPFYQTVQKTGAVEMARITNSLTFLEYALQKVKNPIEQWQKRKEYETVAQWESRVTDANRAKMINEYMTEARNSYLKDNAPKVLTGNLDDYNNEYHFFPITTPSLGTLYVSVPPEEKNIFKSQWAKVELKPVYGILDGEIAVLDCTFILNGKEYKSAQSYDEDDFTQMAMNITPLTSLREYEQMMASSQSSGAETRRKRFEPDVIDVEIPASSKTNDRTFAVIIGNEDYQRVAPVDYAMNDARIFETYCNRTLGIPEKNIRTYYNATYGDIVAAMEDIDNMSKAYNGDINVIFYSAGHGIPDESNRNAYLLPIDATGTQPEVCYPLDKLYSQLGDLNANSVVAFLDACFSGSLRGEGMLASARGIKLRPRDVTATGNLVVLSAASADQSAFPYHEKNHGLFTYYLLKKLNDTEGKVNMGDLADFIVEEVSKTAIVENKKPQKPNVKWSTTLTDKWREINLK